MNTYIKYAAAVLATAFALFVAAPAVSSNKVATRPSVAVATRINIASTAEVKHLRGAIEWHRARTWHFQSLVGRNHTPTTYQERHTRARGKLHWLKSLWNKRRTQAKNAYHRSYAYVRVWTRKQHPCLAGIIDLEDGRWDPTINFGGGHGNTSVAYGLPQADPGTKLAYYSYTNGGHYAGQRTGKDWATNPWVQLKWMRNYTIGRFGSECAAYHSRVYNHTY